MQTTSPLKSLHKNLKSYLLNSRKDLLRLKEAISRFISKAIHTYNNALIQSQEKVRYAHLRKDWLGNLPTRCTTLALNLLTTQYRRAASLLATPGNPIPQPTPPHPYTMPAQYRLVCFYKIRKKIKYNKTHPQITPITIEEVHPFWYTKVDLVSSDPLLRIRKPHAVQARSRPQSAALTLPAAMQIKGYKTHRQKVMAPDLHRNPSQ